MDMVWKYGGVFLAGVITHYILTQNLKREQSKAVVKKDLQKDSNVDNNKDASDSSDEEWNGNDEMKWEQHKMILCVRKDLKMGTGKIGAQCCHATLGAYKRAIKRIPNAVKAWEMLGQAKVCVKIESEEQMMELANVANALNLNHYIVIDAGRTQIAPETKTVLAIGPAPISVINQVTGHLKLL